MDIKKKIGSYLRKEKKSESVNAIFEILKQEGFRPQMEEGYICFKFEGYSMYISLDERDPTYLRIVLPRFFDIDKTNRTRANTLINRLNIRYKFAFLVIDNDEVFSLADICINENNSGQALLRIVNITKEIAHEFCDSMNNHFSDN